MSVRTFAAMVLAASALLACGESDDSAAAVPAGDESPQEATDGVESGTGDAGTDASTGDAATGDVETTIDPSEEAAPATGPTGDPVVDFVVQAPVLVGESTEIGEGLVVAVVRVDDIDLEAQGIGETSGPGVAVIVEIRNDRDEPVDVGGVVVNATVRTDVPATPHFSTPYAPFEGELAPGETATATYPFRVDTADRDSLVVDIHHDRSPNVILVEASS